MMFLKLFGYLYLLINTTVDFEIGGRKQRPYIPCDGWLDVALKIILIENELRWKQLELLFRKPCTFHGKINAMLSFSVEHGIFMKAREWFCRKRRVSAGVW